MWFFKMTHVNRSKERRIRYNLSCVLTNMLESHDFSRWFFDENLFFRWRIISVHPFLSSFKMMTIAKIWCVNIHVENRIVSCCLFAVSVRYVSVHFFSRNRKHLWDPFRQSDFLTIFRSIFGTSYHQNLMVGRTKYPIMTSYWQNAALWVTIICNDKYNSWGVKTTKPKLLSSSLLCSFVVLIGSYLLDKWC